MAKGLKYLLLMLLLILGCSTEPEPEPEPSLCDGLTEVELWGEYYDIATTDTLDLYNQELTDSIPPEIGCLTNLTELRLWGNYLTGEIPPEIGNLTDLTHLRLAYNQLGCKIYDFGWQQPHQYLR